MTDINTMEWECPHCWATNRDCYENDIPVICPYCGAASEWEAVVHEYSYEGILQVREDIAEWKAERMRDVADFEFPRQEAIRNEPDFNEDLGW